MTRRWGQDRPHDTSATAPEWLELGLEVAGVVLFIVLIVIAGIVLFGAPAGAETLEQHCTRPYAELTPEQLPNICTVQFDGEGHATLAGFNPDSGLIWHAATFHVPNPDNWHDGQTATVETTLPAGPFNLTLACQAGAAQVDVWLEGQTDAYADDTTLDCVTPCYLNIAVPVPDAVPSVSERHDDAPCGVGTPQLGAPSGQTGPGVVAPVLSAAIDTTPTNPPPVGVASSAAETAVAPPTVVSAAAATTLANTGFTSALWWRLGLILSAVGLLIVICTWHTGRKVNGR